MNKPLSERLEAMVVGNYGPNANVIREAAELARRVEASCHAYIFSNSAPDPHQVSGVSSKDDDVIDTLDGQRVRLVPEVEDGSS